MKYSLPMAVETPVDTAISLPFPLAPVTELVRPACPADEAEWARAAAGGEPLGAAQGAVGERLQLGIGQMAHDRCSASVAMSSLRARCSHVITVPIGTPSAWAISA